jgi:hypothetical protein
VSTEAELMPTRRPNSRQLPLGRYKVATTKRPTAKQTTYTAAEARTMRWQFKLAIWTAVFSAAVGVGVYWGTTGVHDVLSTAKPDAERRAPTLNLDHVTISGARVGISLPGDSPVQLNLKSGDFSNNQTGIEVRNSAASAASVSAH